jgi:hypothetical protein
MNYKMSFQERAKLAMEHLSRQLPYTYEQALEQVQRLKEMSQAKNKKQRD